ncbi:MAG: hypothetical protein OSB62_02165 [Alphaproteobacteria bacterium]|nr:hypothetical protein [Alphaproteobacteria bacterium]
MAIGAIASAAGKAAGAAGKATGAAGKATGAAAKGAAKRAGKKAKRSFFSKLMGFLSNPITQSFLAIPIPVGVIVYQVIPGVRGEIRFLRLVLSLFGGGAESAISWSMIFMGMVGVLAGATAGSFFGEWGAAIGAAIGALFAGPLTGVGLMFFVIHFFLVCLAWFIIVLKYTMRSVMPKGER